MMVQNKLGTKTWVLCGSALAMALLVCGAAQSSIREKNLDQDLQDLVKALRSIDYECTFREDANNWKIRTNKCKEQNYLGCTYNNRNGYIQKNADS